MRNVLIQQRAWVQHWIADIAAGLTPTRESQGPGDIDNAMNRLEARYGLPFWSLWHLRKGRAKTCDTSLYARIQGAYLDMCKRQVGNLLHEIAMETAGGDDTLADLENEAQILAAKILAKKAGLRLASHPSKGGGRE